MKRVFPFIQLLLMVIASWGVGSIKTAKALISTEIAPDTAASSGYTTGNPVLQELWVDPANGNDDNDGSTSSSSLRTLTAAWDRLPMNTDLIQGVRINLQPGTYTEDMVPLYWEARHGTFTAPIWIRGSGTSRDQVILRASLNIYNTRYLYLENLSILFNGDVLHCELCDHILLRNLVLNGAGLAQETIKVNQSQYFYVENSNISGAYENVIDYVSMQYGHIIGSEIHDAGDWCAYAKGGSAYLLVEGNIIHHCLNGGFTAGQGTGFQYMTSPWLQYETYDIKVVNNVIHDTVGAGLGVNGGYNILLAYNTLYRIGSQSHVLEVVFGLRSCDGIPGDPGRERCQQYLDAGGWGTTIVDNGSNAINIPDRNVYIYNNVVYNPDGFQSAWQHFAIYDARSNPASSNIENATTDLNLQIRGNVIWNGNSSMPLGVEGNFDACIASDTNCNKTQLRAENAINTIQPAFVNAATGDFHPSGDWVDNVSAFDIPDYVWQLSVPPGNNSNAISMDFAGDARIGQNVPGAYINDMRIFDDVSALHWAVNYIERLYTAGMTGGCSAIPLNYCPENPVTRAQMAIFLLKGIHGSSYQPPAINGDTGFVDVATNHWAAPWIKQLFAEGITGGCGTGIYCPEANVTRAQMAIFLLKAKHGTAYLPPAATGVFTDVPVDHWARNWIEQLAVEGITSGCGAGVYCPEADVSRAQMAVFLVKTFNLP